MFIGVTLVNKIILVSGVQFYNTSFVCCAVCLPPEVKTSYITIFSPFTLSYLPPPSFLSGNHHTVVSVYKVFCFCLFVFFFLNPLTFAPNPPHPPHLLFSVSMSLFLFCWFLLFIRFHI